MSLDSCLEKAVRKLYIISCVSVSLCSWGYLREIINSHSANHHPIKRLNFKAFFVNSLSVKDDFIFLNMYVFLCSLKMVDYSTIADHTKCISHHQSHKYSAIVPFTKQLEIYSLCGIAVSPFLPAPL